MNFALTGVAGFVAPRHLKAIADTGHQLVAAADPHDAVGVLDKFAFETRFFTEIERFDRHLEKLRRGTAEARVHYVSICTPNYLHDAHIRLALRVGAQAICEKPIVISPWNLDALQELECETGCRVWTVLQLRVHPALLELKRRIEAEARDDYEVELTYVTARGRWYDVSWKGSTERSGGIVCNIGIHLFDLLLWLFGRVQHSEVHISETRRAAGFLKLERATIRWFLSCEAHDLPFSPQPGVRTTFRSITIDGSEVEFTDGFTDLHTRMYEEVLAGRGFGIEDARPAIELSYRIRTARVETPAREMHPRLAAVT